MSSPHSPGASLLCSHPLICVYMAEERVIMWVWWCVGLCLCVARVSGTPGAGARQSHHARGQCVQPTGKRSTTKEDNSPCLDTRHIKHGLADGAAAIGATGAGVWVCGCVCRRRWSLELRRTFNFWKSLKVIGNQKMPNVSWRLCRRLPGRSGQMPADS